VSHRLRILGTSALAAGIAAAGIAGFAAQARSHPRVETSKAAACAGCHMTDYRGAHGHAGQKPTTCGVCHSQASWHPTHLDHDWPLTGAHEKTKCFACHEDVPPTFHGTPKACVACHEEEYVRAPNHARFPKTCEECHTTSAWKPTLPHHERENPHTVEPVPSASAAPARVTPPPRPTATTPRPRPTARARPTSTATATAPRPTATQPDTVTGASRRR